MHRASSLSGRKASDVTATFNRRTLLGGIGAVGLGATSGPRAGAQPSHVFGLPISDPDGLPGDGFLIRHGFQTENTWYAPGYWHTAEDWYRLNGAETAGANVLAIGPGTIVFVGSNYPGRVVIVQHRPKLFSMYGHLELESITVSSGDRVIRGQQLGSVLQRDDGVPSHLHFETRTFLYTSDVNGESPRYGFACGQWCTPGPGYWPIDAPELPSEMGWRNPTHVIGNRLLLDGPLAVQVATGGGPIELMAAPISGSDSAGRIDLAAGTRYEVQAINAGPEASNETSAVAYMLWYLIDADPDGTGWVRAAIADGQDAGTDGRPSSVRFLLLPVLDRANLGRIKRNPATIPTP